MVRKIFPLILVILLIYSSCGKKDSIESLFHEAENLEADILKSVNTISQCRANYEKILLDAPESEFAPIACYKLGKLNEIFGHYDEALDYYRKLVSYYPENPVSADGLFNIAQINQLHLDNIEEAITAYEQLITFYPNSEKIFQALLQMGQLSCQQDEWEQAIEYFEQIVVKYPENKICDDLYFRMADILQFKIEEETKAIQMYQHLVENYPDSPWIKYAEKRLTELSEGGNKNEN
ncbi:MAG: tetratricopeptide repeat protein [bacterium]|nr:MAG: tetratricopeptide repeat protein [bacterium]